MLYAPHLGLCFGLGLQGLRDECPCPSPCRQLCAASRYHAARSPRHETGQGTVRPYTPVPNDLFEAWNTPGGEPSDAIKLTYLFLVTRTMHNRPRWVVDPITELADRRGISPKTLRKHCAMLKRLGLIRTMPFRDLSDDYNMNEHAIELVDLPAWYRTPGDIDPGADSACDERDDDTARDEDDDQDDRTEVEGAGQIAFSEERRARARRAISLDKLRSQHAEVRARRAAEGDAA